MKLPLWIRILWWLILTGGLGAFLFSRLTSLTAGAGTPFDVAALILFAGLALAPVFSEVTLWGVSLKQHIDEAKREIKQDVDRLRSDVVASLHLTSAVSQQIVVSAPPPDSHLSDLRVQIEDAIRAALAAQPQRSPSAPPVPPAFADDLFKVRYLLDREIRRIASGRDLESHAPGFEGRRSTVALTRVLERADILAPR